MLEQEIEISEIRLITDLIRQKYDYDFTNYAMSSFKRRVARVLEVYKMDSVATLLRRLDADAKFFKEFLTEITVNVTEMFRDPTCWVALRDQIIPNILQNNNRFSIWHAGCSSGEEVYSMAILLEEMGILDNVRIVATDIDHVILDKAREARYHIKNMEVNKKNYATFGGKFSLEKYYREENGKAVMNKNLVRNVEFREQNLVTGTPFSKFDLILCRNVMIYFNQTLQNQVLKLFHDSLFKYGYLVIGSKESLIWCELANKFIVVNNEDKIYKKIRD
ncbi:CheR family methyltransferase [Raineya orbicola]|jgi:chemotaxis protein methyltransferase CheR|uniref:Methylase of chemotaxis methyl-accepting protein n=1 Tax=Raineya orbicola TaxID=2016530 RepID=A0A2N3I134_9BACT|nr:protein-glutamate O-methyltransferase CheR [Raineya orbicola]PKQ64014.1 Methylase of chemotaxis methyl-accepting protein [Raineya orbicola]